jgi:NitT/TauT family transport system permease protein
MADVVIASRAKPRRRSAWHLPGRIVFERLLLPVMLIAAWEVVARAHVFPSSLFPAPSRVALVMFDWVTGRLHITESYSGHWFSAAASSTWRVVFGYALAAVAAVCLGISVGWSRQVERIVDPTVQLLRPIPPVSWIPLAIIWFGVADRPAIFLVVIGAFFPIYLNTVHGVRTIDRNLIRAAAMMGATSWQMLRFVVWPAAMPSILAGMRISVGAAWMLTVTAEMVAVKSGLGYALWDTYYFLRYDMVIAAMVSIGLIGFASDVLVKAISRRVLAWQHASTLQARRGD